MRFLSCQLKNGFLRRNDSPQWRGFWCLSPGCWSKQQVRRRFQMSSLILEQTIGWKTISNFVIDSGANNCKCHCFWSKLQVGRRFKMSSLFLEQTIGCKMIPNVIIDSGANNRLEDDFKCCYWFWSTTIDRKTI